MKIVHVFKNTNEKFYDPYIQFIFDNFNANNHSFFLEKYSDFSYENLSQQVEEVSKLGYLKLIINLYKAEKIILHSLLSPRMNIILFLNPWLLKKCYWTVWGADLYYYHSPKNTLSKKIYEYIRRKIIKNLFAIITQVEGDYDLAVEWYKSKAKFFYCFLYPSNLYKDISIETTIDLKKIANADKKTILIGNSGDPNNNHLEILQKLKILNKNEGNLKIIVPLSYGGTNEYVSEIIDFGKQNFGDNFVSLTGFLEFSKYLEILNSVDIAIFNHDRQQALGNIISLIGLGKKVYIKERITTWDFCLKHKLKVFSLENELDDFSRKISKQDSCINMLKVQQQFSIEKLRNDWKKVFDYGN